MLLKLLSMLGNLAPIGKTVVNRYFDSKDYTTKTVADWEHEAIKASKGSWKDEFLTLVFSAPIVLQILGNIIFTFTGHTAMLDAADRIYDAFVRVGLDYTQVMMLIIGASFGVHLSRTYKDAKRSKAASEIAKAKTNGTSSQGEVSK